jgi:nicotinate dehydrogenase subunit B
MNKRELPDPVSRRQMLQALGAFIVLAPAVAEAAEPTAARAAGRAGAGNGAAAGALPPRHPGELDAWLAIGRDGRVTAYYGKPDIGIGVNTAIAQIVAEELDVPVTSIDLVVADTALTFDQGGVSGSTGIQRGAVPLRNAAAEARAVLLAQAAAKLATPIDRLQVRDGIIASLDDASRHTSYAELVNGGAFDRKLEWNGVYGNGLVATGKAKPKTPDQYRLVGTSVPRFDVPAKSFAQFDYITDMRRPGMLYGRALRPAVAGATPVSVDEASIAHIAGARVLRKGNFIAVVANSEWDAVQASRAVKLTWSEVPEPFVPHTELYDYLRKAPVVRRVVDKSAGDVDAALAGAHVVSAEYEWPYQSHASMTPACAVAEVTAEDVTVWHSSQKPHAASQGIAKMLGLPVEKVRSISTTGPGSYGRNDAGDAAADAVIMAQLTGRPVRVQGARSDGHGWDPKGAASVHFVSAALGSDGKLTAYRYFSKGFSRVEVSTSESKPNDLLAGMLVGFDNVSAQEFGTPEDGYAIPNRQMGWETVPTMLRNASPLRTSHLRDPLGPQVHFASESFIDECALAAGADPIEFRLRHFTDQRHIAVVKAAAEKAKWHAGPPGARRSRRGKLMVGRGFAYTPRGETLVAMVAEVEVDPATGRVWARHFVVAHDCGLVVNPENLRQCIEGNIVQSMSRALFEEVTFDKRNVTSIDWATYPILDIKDCPESIDIVLIDRKEAPPSGAGEPSTRTTAAAIANAIFDATGVRLRRAPFTPERVKAALRGAGIKT